MDCMIIASARTSIDFCDLIRMASQEYEQACPKAGYRRSLPGEDDGLSDIEKRF